jgi:hypothetical protein
MKHWPFYIAIFVFIVLRSIRIKEGNFNIPKQAEVYNTPIELIGKMTDIMDNKQTNDMVENKNVKYDLTAAQDYLSDAKNILATDKATRDNCNVKLEQTIQQNDVERRKYTVCLANLSDQTKLHSKCRVDVLPATAISYNNIYNTVQDTTRYTNDCNKQLRTEKDAVVWCRYGVNIWDEKFQPWWDFWIP